MLRAAERLDKNAPTDALPHEQAALAKIEELQKKLNKWQLANAQEQLQETVQALQDAKAKIEKLSALESQSR